MVALIFYVNGLFQLVDLPLGKDSVSYGDFWVTIKDTTGERVIDIPIQGLASISYHASEKEAMDSTARFGSFTQ